MASELISYPLLTLFEKDLVNRVVYEDETLQALVNKGAITSPLGHDTFTQLRPALPRKLATGNLAWLSRFGIADLALTGEQLLADGATLPNDLDDPATLAALNRHSQGRPLCGGVAMHGAFFVGPSVFYEKLRQLAPARRALIGMTSVAEVNRIYTHYRLEQLQRQKARFINITMKATLLGHAVSDQLEDGQVVSGVGGQYNFVAMAHQLPDARSILLVKATRGSGKTLESNIIWEYGHSTIPRHLRDMFISEYGIADLRGKSDAECIDAMVKIADSRFQDTLIAQAQKAGKLPAHYQLPARYRNNLPERLHHALAPFAEHLPQLPFGSELTEAELALAGKLQNLQQRARSLGGKAQILWQLLRAQTSEEGQAALAHLSLSHPQNWRQRLYRRLILSLY